MAVKYSIPVLQHKSNLKTRSDVTLSAEPVAIYALVWFDDINPRF